jgi:hypothetical protein
MPVPHVLVWAKLLGETAILKVSAAVPLSVMVTVCTALGVPTTLVKFKGPVVERLMPGEVVPTPLKVTVCGLPEALSEMVKVPLTVVVLVGV